MEKCKITRSAQLCFRGSMQHLSWFMTGWWIQKRWLPTDFVPFRKHWAFPCNACAPVHQVLGRCRVFHRPRLRLPGVLCCQKGQLGHRPVPLEEAPAQLQGQGHQVGRGHFAQRVRPPGGCRRAKVGQLCSQSGNFFLADKIFFMYLRSPFFIPFRSRCNPHGVCAERDGQYIGLGKVTWGCGARPMAEK